MSDRSPALEAATQRKGFRPDIEGLRAVAVLLVLAYHARMPGFGGGFIGVDVFFVISGFLITGVITRELSSTGRLSLRQFYARRIRRLLPAALVVIVATVVASAILLPPLRVLDVAADGAAAALYVSNIRFAMQATDYLQANTRGAVLVVDGAPIWSSGREDLWTAGVERLLTSIRESAGEVVLLGDTPDPVGDPPVCLSDHLDDVLACATPSRWAVDRGHMDADRRAAEQAGVGFIDPSRWVCPTEPCPATIDRFVVYRDDHHMTATFARALATYLDAALPALPAGEGQP